MIPPQGKVNRDSRRVNRDFFRRPGRHGGFGTCHDGSLKHPMSRHVLHTVGYKMWIIHCLYHTGATVCRVMVRICQNPE